MCHMQFMGACQQPNYLGLIGDNRIDLSTNDQLLKIEGNRYQTELKSCKASKDGVVHQITLRYQRFN